MKQVNVLCLSLILITGSLAGCLLGGDDNTDSVGCTDSGAVNYDSGADEDDGSCVMPAELSELEAAGLQQMLEFDQKGPMGDLWANNCSRDGSNLRWRYNNYCNYNL